MKQQQWNKAIGYSKDYTGFVEAKPVMTQEYLELIKLINRLRS